MPVAARTICHIAHSRVNRLLACRPFSSVARMPASTKFLSFSPLSKDEQCRVEKEIHDRAQADIANANLYRSNSSRCCVLLCRPHFR
ncbi:hypothetical protein XU18_5154 [Perkinsela sp. CCAP 1560/4]|nr:hypothetical protein XU18_5154 [Perkinsela sp. CCAP 1560/4]|eukprot:KNH01786.1 hypothetical protein XU18_5154 [Perkinsela sp. CCAP 1560/4]